MIIFVVIWLIAGQEKLGHGVNLLCANRTCKKGSKLNKFLQIYLIIKIGHSKELAFEIVSNFFYKKINVWSLDGGSFNQ